MDWLTVVSDENQDMHHEFIGNLIMRDGFKVRYKEVEVYSDDLRDTFVNTFSKNGYNVKITYNNTFAYCEILAVKKENRYGDVAITVAIAWAIYRVYLYLNV